MIDHRSYTHNLSSLQTGSQRGRKKKHSAIESVIPWAKRVGAWIRERLADAGELSRHSLVTRPLSARHAHPRLHSASSL